MSRNTLKNVTEHNNALHKKQQKIKLKKLEREEKLKAIARKFNEQKEN
jgi:hypothetical protein